MNVLNARSLIADATGRPVDSVPPTAAIGTFQGWDSLAHMRLVDALELSLGRRLTSDEVVGIRSLSDVAALLGPEVRALRAAADH